MLTGTIHHFSGRHFSSRMARVMTSGIGALVLSGLIAVSPASAAKDYTVLEDVEGFDPNAIEYATPSDLADDNLLLDVVRANGRLVAVGEFGHIIYSDDRGETWTQAETVPTQVTLTTVAFPTDKVGFAAGHDTTIVKTEDGGVTWERVYHDFDAETPIFGLYFDTPQPGLAVGAFSLVLETNDGGEPWEQRDVVDGGDYDYHLNDIFQAKDGTIYIAAEFGNVFRSTDKGASFQAIKTPYEGSFWSGLGLADGSVLVYGMRGNVYHTVDAGETWAKVPTDTKKSFGGGVQLDSGDIILVGLNGAVAYSSDGGNSFLTTSRRDREGYNAVADGPDGKIVIFGVPGVKIMPDNAEDAIAQDDVSS